MIGAYKKDSRVKSELFVDLVQSDHQIYIRRVESKYFSQVPKEGREFYQFYRHLLNLNDAG